MLWLLLCVRICQECISYDVANFVWYIFFNSVVIVDDCVFGSFPTRYALCMRSTVKVLLWIMPPRDKWPDNRSFFRILNIFISVKLLQRCDDLMMKCYFSDLFAVWWEKRIFYLFIHAKAIFSLSNISETPLWVRSWVQSAIPP